jgi:hypothetical protein
MTDRELLELAAKACGFGSPSSGDCCWTESEYPKGSGLKGALWNYVGWGQNAELWNPLTDDGDALRLAVKLDLLMDVCTVSGGIRAAQVLWSACGPSRITEEHRTDPYAATRRAITRAAATLAKGEGKV